MQLYTLNDVIGILGVSKPTLRKWVREELFPEPIESLKGGNRRFWNVSDVDRWTKARRSIEAKNGKKLWLEA